MGFAKMDFDIDSKFHHNIIETDTMSGKVHSHVHDAVHWHVNEITSRIIAETRIPSDRFHLGKIILQSLKDDPEMVAQIDGATSQSESNASLLKRSIQCAISFRKLGLQRGDVMFLMAPNHLDLVVPFYAAFFEGIIVAPIDKTFGISELIDSFQVNKPKIIFCQSEKVEDIQEALNKSNVVAKVVSFDSGSHGDTFGKLLEFGSDEKAIEKYRAADFDPAETIAMLIPTSGTTGLPKSSAATHKNFAVMGPYIWAKTTEIPFFRSSLVSSSLQWLSAIVNYIYGPIFKFKRIQSSMPSTQEHLYHLINTFKPMFTIMSPTMMTTLLKPGDRERCDFSCFKLIYLGGSAVYADLISELKQLIPDAEIVNVYGMSELTCLSFAHGLSSPPRSCGKPMGCLQYRLVDSGTGNDVNEPNKNGELWLKGPGFFKGYYNNPKATKEVFTEDGWFKTGDVFYRDEAWNFYFVERIKLLLKYRNHQVSPVEIEGVIIQHPGVLDVAVTGIPDRECGELPVACVVRKSGYNVTAQEIKDLVKDTLTDTKQLRGGVVFLDQLPATASTKLHRRQIKDMVLTLKRE